MTAPTKQHPLAFLMGGGEMGGLTRQHAWTPTPVGPPEHWPQSLRTALSILLHAKVPMLLWWGPDFTQFYNDACLLSLAATQQHPTALGQPAADCWVEKWTTVRPLLDQVLREEVAVVGDHQLLPLHRNGRREQAYWQLSYNPVWNEKGVIAGILLVGQEPPLLASLQERERLQFALDAGQFGFWESDITADRLHMNDRSFELKGLTGSQYASTAQVQSRHHPDDTARVVAAYRRLWRGETDGQLDISYRTASADGQSWRWVRSQARAYFTPEGEPTRYGGIIQDITKEVEAQQQIEANAAYLQLLFKQAAVGIVIFEGPRFRIETANLMLCALWGCPEDQVLGKPFAEVRPPAVDPEGQAALVRVWQTGQPFQGREVPLTVNRAGQAVLVYVDLVNEPLFDTSGQLFRIIQTVTDVTERVLARRHVEELLERERKLNEVKSNFVTLASHEFRTPMGTILSSAALIGRYHGPDEANKRDRHVQRIKAAVTSLGQVLEDFLALSRLEQHVLGGPPRPFAIRPFCEETIEDMQGILRPGQRLAYRHVAGPVTVALHGQLLKHILLNLLGNASKYSADNQQIIFTTAVQHRQLQLTVQDEGIGIPDEDKDKLFGNFFRARNAGHISGTGLGLYVVKRYVDLLGGSITFTSQLGLGTTFTVQLPLAPLPVPV